MKHYCWMGMIAGLLLTAGCVETQDFVILENRVSALEMDNVRHLEQQRSAKETLPRIQAKMTETQQLTREKYAEIKAMNGQLREEIRALEGRVEAAEFMLSKVGPPSASPMVSTDLQRLDNAITRNYQRILALETHLGFEPADMPATVTDAGGSDRQNTGADEAVKMYTDAKNHLDNGRNEESRKAFEAFIKAFPDSDNADNARFWIADSYYRDKWYEKAILEYQKVIEGYPDGNKVAAALLKQGYAFANLGEKGNARLILKELIRKYPQSSEAGIAREKIDTLK